MFKTIVLTIYFTNGFAQVPMVSLGACLDVMVGLPPALIVNAECVSFEMIATPGSVYAPERAPLPKPKPGRNV